MFGLSLISTKKLNHLASECSKLAIANVELSKQNATQSKTIMEKSKIMIIGYYGISRCMKMNKQNDKKEGRKQNKDINTRTKK